jgi:hypothetical protein
MDTVTALPYLSGHHQKLMMSKVRRMASDYAEKKLSKGRKRFESELKKKTKK